MVSFMTVELVRFCPVFTRYHCLITIVTGTKKDPGQQKEYVKKQANQPEAPRNVSQQVMGKIEQKLSGTEFLVGTVPGGCSVQDQINKLIEQATFAENLCQAYIGWCPFW